MRAREGGYALLLAIVVVAVLSLAALAAARAQSDAVASMSRLGERSAIAISVESLMNRVAFLMVTEPADGQALLQHGGERWRGERLKFDGSWYAIDGMPSAALSVQDEAGLFSLNAADQQGLAELLRVGGAGRDADRLAATLMDYVDEDDLVRDGGGEGREYARVNLPPPPDRALASRWQARESLGWGESSLDSGAWDWLTAGSIDAALNVNTAPAPVLAAVLGDRRRAEAIMRRRDASALTDLAEVEGLTGGVSRADSLSLGVTTGRVFRVQAVFGSQRARHGIERRLELGGGDAAQPFRWIEEREVGLAPLPDGESIISLSLDAPAS